ncbi:MAG TPA: hypothetical protein VH518_24965 [Tepidisphaeraceae bacterium]
MKRITPNNSNHSNCVFEMLEGRQLMSGDLSFSNAVSEVQTQISSAIARLKSALKDQANSGGRSHHEGTSKKKPLTQVVAELKSNAELLGASKAALARAIRIAGQDNAGSEDAAQRVLIVDGMKLPPDALKAKLNAKELLQHVADLNLVGADQKPQDAAYWRTVVTKGADVALSGVVAEQLQVPAAVAKRKTAKELLQGAADIAIVGGDARSAAAWKGLALAKAGKISVEQFAQKYTDGKDVGQGAQQSAQNGQGAQDAKVDKGQLGDIVQGVVDHVVGSGTGTGSGTTGTGAAGGAGGSASAPVDAGNVADVGNGVANQADATDATAAPTSGQTTATIHNVQNENGTSSYDLDIHNSDGTTEHAHVTVASDGSATIEYSNGDTVHTDPGSYDQMPAEGEGQTVVISEDQDGDGTAETGVLVTDDGSGDGNGDDGDKKDDGSGDNSSSSDNNSGTDTSSNGGSQGEPNPESSFSDPAKAIEFLLGTPVGRMLLRGSGGRGLIDPVKGSRGHGAADPADSDDGSNSNPAAAAAFAAAFGTVPMIKNANGTVDYADDHASSSSIVIDANVLRAIQIRSGGAVGGPDVGKGSTGNTGAVAGTAPVAPPRGATSVFSNVAIQSQSVSSLVSSVTVKVNAASLH